MEVNEPRLAYNKRKYTLEEYFEMENASEVKHEYYQGEIFAMAGATIQHNFVKKNIVSVLDRRLESSPCQPYNGDTRVYVESNMLVTYPDVTIICGEVLTLNNDKFNVLNPTIIFEILSTATRNYDKGEKFGPYRNIPTLKQYILVEPELVNVEALHINEQGFWELREYRNIDDMLLLSSINVSVPLADIYKRTDTLEQLTNKK